jgi:hypothetical protein
LPRRGRGGEREQAERPAAAAGGRGGEGGRGSRPRGRRGARHGDGMEALRGGRCSTTASPASSGGGS